MKTYRAVAYNRPTSNTPVAGQTKSSTSGKKVLVGLHVPIDVNFDHLDDAKPAKDKIEGKKQYVRGPNTDTDTDQSEKKNGMTLVVIASMTLFLFLLAGISIKYTDKSGSTSVAALVDSDTQTTQNLNVPAATADNALGSLSDILSSRISLISSNNPKFIVTEKGKKIVPNDIIDGSLTVVDIRFDHIVVTSNGANLKIGY